MVHQQHTVITEHAGERRRFVNPQDLICAGCGEDVRCEAPGYWRVTWGLPAAQFSHQDATPLCGTGAGAVAEPIEAGLPALRRAVQVAERAVADLSLGPRCAGALSSSQIQWPSSSDRA
jgi:hypothetical protein